MAGTSVEADGNHIWRMVVAFALALMSKPMAVSLPFLLLLLFDYWPFRRLEELPFSRTMVSKLTVEKLPLFADERGEFCAHGDGARCRRLGDGLVAACRSPARIENAASPTCRVHRETSLWPAQAGDVLSSSIFTRARRRDRFGSHSDRISAVALYFRRNPYFAVGWFFFLIALIPVIGIVQVGFQGMADRYMYIPAIGLFIALVWGLAISLNIPVARDFLWSWSLCRDHRLWRMATRHVSRYWQNGVTLFAQAETAWGRPDMWLEQLYGNALFSSGRIDEALEHYQAVLRNSTPDRILPLQHRTYSSPGVASFATPSESISWRCRLHASRDMALLCLNESGEALMQLGIRCCVEVPLRGTDHRSQRLTPCSFASRSSIGRRRGTKLENGGTIVSEPSAMSCFPGCALRSSRNSFAKRAADVSSLCQLRAVPHVGALVRRRSGRLDHRELSDGKWLRRVPPGDRYNRDCFQPGAVECFQIRSRTCTFTFRSTHCRASRIWRCPWASRSGRFRR